MTNRTEIKPARYNGDTVFPSTPAALVTGASSGIGVYYAKELARRGYPVILVSNQEKEIKEIAREIAAETGCADLTPVAETAAAGGAPLRFDNGQLPQSDRWVMGLYKDLAREDAAETLFDFYPHIEVLINNAGIFIFRDTADCSTGKIETILNLHILTVTKLCRLYGQQMKENKKGYILNMSSISAHTPFPGISLYTATKSYILTFSKALRYEMSESGVKILVVAPGAVATDLYNLPPNLQRLGMRLGIIYNPQKLAKKALNRLFKGKRIFIPGMINRLFSPVFALLPGCAVLWIRKKTRRFMK